MPALFHPLLTLIASATNRELARYLQFLKEENKILRSRLSEQVHTTPAERQWLVHFGKGLGRAIEELITIVVPSTRTTTQQIVAWMLISHVADGPSFGISLKSLTQVTI